MKVELRSSTAIGGVLYVVTTGGLRKLSWCADSWAIPLQQIIGGIVKPINNYQVTSPYYFSLYMCNLRLNHMIVTEAFSIVMTIQLTSVELPHVSKASLFVTHWFGRYYRPCFDCLEFCASCHRWIRAVVVMCARPPF